MPIHYLCDSYDDCPGGFDEQNCTTSKSISLSLYILHSRYLLLVEWQSPHYSNCKFLETVRNWHYFPVNYVPQVREEQMVRICLCVHVCVAPPMIVGEWSMAVVL